MIGLRHSVLLVFSLVLFTVPQSVFAQRNARIGYVDLDYILSKIPAYDNAEKTLEAKVEMWKKEIVARQLVIDELKKALEVERILLTEDLIKDREMEISAAVEELLQYKQQRFGPTGDLMFQRKALMQPIQDEVFLIIKQLGDEKKYDFIFEKSSDAVMLYSQKRYDLSDLVIREFAQMNKRSDYKNSDKEINKVEPDKSPAASQELQARDEEKEAVVDMKQQALEAKKKAQADARAKRKADYEARKKKLMEARKAKSKKSTQETKDSIS